MTVAIFEQILDELRDVLSQTDPQEEETFVRELLSAERIFVCGLGRSGLMMRAFAMRLMHLGLTSFVVGETTTPSIQEGDLLAVGSGSGETSTPVSIARLAKKAGATVAALTGHRDSTLAQLADVVILIPVRGSPLSPQRGGSPLSPQGGGSPLFPQGGRSPRLPQGKSTKVTRTVTSPSFQPLGSLAEQSMLIYLDSIVARLWSKIGGTPEELLKRHANLE